MRNPKTKAPRANSPQVTVFPQRPEEPQNLRREISTSAQRNPSEDTIIYGEDDALPLRIAQAVDDSPATSSCLETIAQFIKGSGFSNKDIAKTKIDSAGTTLWDLHCALADSISLFWGFAVNFKFSRAGKILNTYQMSFESCRFRKPEGNSPDIKTIVYNPYFGTELFRKEYTKEYPVYDLGELPIQINAEEYKGKEGENKFPGQVYYYGRTSPLSRFYPKPKYWTGRKWIYIDGKVQEAHAENLDNGWFQSVLMNVIGDPSSMSKNPKYQEEYTDESGAKRKRSTKTVGEEFNEQMSGTFSGTDKMGTVQVHWSNNENTATKVTAFPTNANADLFLALQDLTTKNITIATRVPSILANISEGVSLGSGGSEIQKAIELMQSRTSEWRMVLENFYNEVLLPNLQTAVTEKIQILNYNPITVPVTIDKQFWDSLNQETKMEFIRKNIPSVTLMPSAAELTAPIPGTPLPDGTTVPAPTQIQGNENLRSWSMSDLNKIQKIVARYNLSLSDPTNGKALTFEQAKQILLGYGLTDEDINAWIVKPEEL